MRQFAEDPPVEERVAAALDDRNATLAIAETCTGGGIASLVTDVPGASEFFDRAFVPYSYDSLREDLGLTREALDEHGVVSRPIARQLARRARDVADATWGLSTVGLAGPSGGTEDTPVGTAFVGIAYAGPWGTESSFARAERHAFDGDRRAVRERIARAALGSLLDRVGETGDV